MTGGSQGFGLAVAKRLAQRGANVVIVAQNVEKLKHAVQAIAASALHPSTQRFHFISADLRKSSETDRVIAETMTWNDGNPPDTVWCSAGHCLPGFFRDTSPEVLRGQMDTIYWSAANMAHSILKVWVPSSDSHSEMKPTTAPTSTSPRHIVFTCSVLALYPLAGYAAYNPCKAAMRCLSDTLVQELAYYNGSRRHASSSKSTPAHPEIKIHTIFPMGIRSPGFETEEKLKPKLTLKLEEADEPQEPEKVAEMAFAGLDRGDYLITTHWIGHLMKGATLMVSPTNGWGIWDSLLSGVGWAIFRFVGWDQKKTCVKMGEKDGRESKGVSVSPYS